jgi:hypothetical protein
MNAADRTPIRRTVTGADAQRLAELVNALPVAYLGPRTGTFDDGRAVVAVITTEGPPITVGWGANGVSFKTGATTLLPLDSTTAFETELADLIGQPLR